MDADTTEKLAATLADRGQPVYVLDQTLASVLRFVPAASQPDAQPDRQPQQKGKGPQHNCEPDEHISQNAQDVAQDA